jgi:hypothetical protein
VRVDEKSGSGAAALQIATSQYYAGLSKIDDSLSKGPFGCMLPVLWRIDGLIHPHTFLAAFRDVHADQ